MRGIWRPAAWVWGVLLGVAASSAVAWAQPPVGVRAAVASTKKDAGVEGSGVGNGEAVRSRSTSGGAPVVAAGGGCMLPGDCRWYLDLEAQLGVGGALQGAERFWGWGALIVGALYRQGPMMFQANAMLAGGGAFGALVGAHAALTNVHLGVWLSLAVGADVTQARLGTQVATGITLFGVQWQRVWGDEPVDVLLGVLRIPIGAALAWR